MVGGVVVGADGGGAVGTGEADGQELESLGDFSAAIGTVNTCDEVDHGVVGLNANGGETDDLVTIGGHELAFGEEPGLFGHVIAEIVEVGELAGGGGVVFNNAGVDCVELAHGFFGIARISQ